jgi:xanthine dehydrogenase accessory factor
VAARLHRAGLRVLVTELAQPLVVRRRAAFAEAVFAGETTVEGIHAKLAKDVREVEAVLRDGAIPVLVDEAGMSIARFHPVVLVDARMLKRAPETGLAAAELVVGLGPGFSAGEDCHAVVETMRGHDMGRVMWSGGAQADTGVPEAVMKRQGERVLWAPVDGVLADGQSIGERVHSGDVLARIGETAITAPFDGVLRGLAADGVAVKAGMKIGDLDPRDDPALAFRISDKALAVGGGVLEAMLTRPAIRAKLWR